MRSTLLGLSVPLLLFAAAFATVIPEASAQDDEHYVVSGTVEDDDGNPIAGARINAYTYPDGDDPRIYSSSIYRGADAVTDEDGQYSLKLAPGKGYINVYFDEWRIGDGRELVVEDEDVDVDFTLKAPPPKTAIIQGTVVDEDGDPVEGAQVTLGYGCCYIMPYAREGEVAATDASEGGADAKMAIMPPYYDDYASAVTDEDGEFTFKAYGGPRQITAWAKGYAQTTVQVTAVDDETTQVEVELEKVPDRDAILEGKVVDDKGLPVADAHVSVRSLEWGRWAEGVTGKDGRYRVQTVPGWSEITVSVYSYGQPMPVDADAGNETDIARPIYQSQQYYPLSLLMDLDSGDNDGDLELEAKPTPTIALVGYVVDPIAKKGVADAHVSVWNHETGDWGEATTDKTGSFKILVREGHYSANAWKEGYLGGTQTFVVTDDATQRVDLVMPKGTTKWAPCYDDECGGPIMYATKDAYAGSGSTGSAGVATPEAAPTTSDGDAATRSATGAQTLAAEDASASSAPQFEGSASYPGEGGGLPEYDPAAANSVPAAQQQSGPSEIPGLGVLALVAVAGVLALALRRK